jgi:hypothetical protein
MTRAVPPAAVRVLQDALAQARAARITDPATVAQHAASALTAHGWCVTAEPPHLSAYNPTQSAWTTGDRSPDD